MSPSHSHAPASDSAPAHLMIRASAGTGKTFRLVHRYLGLIARGIEPWQIVAATFTRAAAAEITDRLVTRLAAACSDATVREELAHHARAPVLRDPDNCRILLGRLVRNGHRLQVGTIDSTFARFAQAFAFDLGLPPAWRMANQDTPEDTQLHTDAVHRLLETYDPQTLPVLIRLMNRGNATRSISDDLRKTLDGVLSLYRESAPGAWDWLPQPATEPETTDEATGVQALLDLLAAVDCPTTSKGTPNKNWHNELERIATALRASDWEGLVAKGVADKILRGESTYNRWPIPPQLVTLTDQVLARLRREVLTNIARQTGATHALVQAFEQQREQLIAERGLLRFDDVAHALANTHVTGRADDIAYQLDGRVHHLLLDEFQDTSVTQWNVLSPLAEELLSTADGSRGLFIVGDPKQSIYGWRGGEPELFNAIAEQHDQTITTQTLDLSYRSSEPVIEAVNTVFHHLPQSSFALENQEKLGPGIAAWHKGWARHKTHKSDLPGYAQLITHDDEHGDTLTHAAHLIRSQVAQTPRATVGVLVRSNDAVTRLRYLLRIGTPSITASGLGGTPLSDSPAVALVLSLLTLADHPGDTAARFHVATSPAAEALGFTDHHSDVLASAFARQCRASLLHEGYASTLLRWAKVITPHATPRDAERLMRLVERAMRQDLDPGLRPSMFVKAIQAERQPEPSADRVQVMTIHQSKGLEFDVVILPELHKSILQTGGRPYMYERDHAGGPVSRVAVAVKQDDAKAVTELQPLFDEANRRLTLDAISSLYVAMTRARHALHMIAPQKCGAVSWAQLLASALDEPLDSEAQQDGDDLAEGCQRVWSCGDARWHEPLDAKPSASAEAPPAPSSSRLKIQLRKSAQRDRQLPRRSPSDHPEQRVRLSKVLEPRTDASRTRGSAIHALFEQITWLDDGQQPSLDQTVEQISERCPLPRHVIEPHLTAFQTMLTRPPVRAALTEPTTAENEHVELWRERRFVVRDPDEAGTLIEGVFDRVVVWRDTEGRATRAQIIDFKSDHVSGDALIERAATYRSQIAAYRAAARVMLNLPAAKITGRLLFVEAGQAVDC